MTIFPKGYRAAYHPKYQRRRGEFLQDEFDDDTATLLHTHSRSSTLLDQHHTPKPSPTAELEMPVFGRTRMTVLMYCIFMASLLLFALSIAGLAMEGRVLYVFKQVSVQLPGTSPTEWEFVTLDPKNIDHSPTIAIFVAGSLALISSMLGMAWITMIWRDTRATLVRRFGLATCFAVIATTAFGLAITAYVFIVESQMQLPKFYANWKHATFTREFYICAAFPSVIGNAEGYYGFEACDYAQAARFIIVGLSLFSTSLAALGVLQAYQCGALQLLVASPYDIEKAVAARARAKRVRSFGPELISAPMAERIELWLQNQEGPVDGPNVSFQQPPAVVHRESLR